MKRALALLLCLAGCPEATSQKVSLVTVPAVLPGPCLISRIAVYDDLGTEYRPGIPDCNEAVIELPPGRRFMGAELQSAQVESFSVYLSE